MEPTPELADALAAADALAVAGTDALAAPGDRGALDTLAEAVADYRAAVSWYRTGNHAPRSETPAP